MSAKETKERENKKVIRVITVPNQIHGAKFVLYIDGSSPILLTTDQLHMSMSADFVGVTILKVDTEKKDAVYHIQGSETELRKVIS